MKKLFLSIIAIFLLFSCKDDDKYARFEKDNYTVYHDEIPILTLNSSEDVSLFKYSSNDPVIQVSSSGSITAIYVGDATISATYKNLVAKCQIKVIPYEDLYTMVPLLEKGMSRSLVRAEEILIRDTLPGASDVLRIAPSEYDPELDSLVYYFENDGLISVSAFLKEGVSDARIKTFMEERYPYIVDFGFKDLHSGATVAHDVAVNKIDYTF